LFRELFLFVQTGIKNWLDLAVAANTQFSNMKNLIKTLLVAVFPLFLACGGHRPASEEYIDSTNVVPNSTVNPPDNTATTIDTTLKTDTPASADTAVNRADTSVRARDTGRRN
jgi:hypothetical protein